MTIIENCDTGHFLSLDKAYIFTLCKPVSPFMGKAILLYFCFLFSTGMYAQPPDPGNTIRSLPDTSRYQDALITASIFSAQNNTWGYDIYVNHTLLIHQPSIPCYAGRDGFRTKKNALSVAELVITKIRKGLMPPTVTKAELKALGIKLQD